MPFPFEPHGISVGFNGQASYGPHEGIDLNVAGTSGNQDCGTQINSISDGACVYSGYESGNYGNLTIIETVFEGKIYYLRYCHLQSLFLNAGDKVKVGDKIGNMGSTGNSTACHLHFDILKKTPFKWRMYTKSVLDWYADPIWFITNYKGETMPTDLQNYLGVADDLAAKARLKENLGERDGKCNWGAEGDQGGHLGAARRDLHALQAITATQIEAARNEGYKNGYEDGKKEATGLPASPVDLSKYVENGASVETTVGNIKTIVSYKLK